MRRLTSAGDTIVEVLLALTVVSAILGGAYITSNRNLNNNRQAEERGEALKVAESQLERLKAVVNAGSNTPYTIASSFCIDNNNAVQSATIPDDQLDNFDAYQAACQVSSAGPTYYVSVKRSDTNKFTVAVKWDRAGGDGQDTVTLQYRLPSLTLSGVTHA